MNHTGLKSPGIFQCLPSYEGSSKESSCVGCDALALMFLYSGTKKGSMGLSHPSCNSKSTNITNSFQIVHPAISSAVCMRSAKVPVLSDAVGRGRSQLDNTPQKTYHFSTVGLRQLDLSSALGAGLFCLSWASSNCRIHWNCQCLICSSFYM